MTYEEALSYIHSVSWRGSRPGLERIGKLCHALSDPQESLKFIHVAGTNGKGSFCALADAVLREAGYRTGLFTSPFVERFNERISIDGRPISDKELCDVIERIMPVAESLEDPPTEFELITAAALLFYAENGCDYVVFEAGMGGRLICKILSAAPKMNAKFILVPHDDAPLLREYLAQNGYVKSRDEIVCSGGKFYPVIVCEKGGSAYSPDLEELMYGTSPLDADCVKYAKARLAALEKICLEINLVVHNQKK